MVKQTWAIEDHLCSGCGGRILRCVTGNGMTPGGDPVYRCADCGKASSALGPDVLCWCGFHMRGNHHLSSYRCLSFAVLEKTPELEAAFKACGCDPKRGEVGVVLEADYRRARHVR